MPTFRFPRNNWGQCNFSSDYRSRPASIQFPRNWPISQFRAVHFPSPLGRGCAETWNRGPMFLGDVTVEAHISTRAIAALHPAPGDRRNVEQEPACGMRPWSRSRARRSNADLMRVSGVRSPEGPLFRPTTRHPSTIRSEPAPPSAGAGVRVERRKVIQDSLGFHY